MQKRNVVVVMVLMLSLSMRAQDIHFSQFYMSPLTLNPAMTGVMNCNNRFVANYRNQWAPVLKSAAYQTYAVSYDHKTPVGQYDYFGFGGAFWGDVAGSLNFGTVKALGSVAFSKRMIHNKKSNHYLAVGANAGIAQRRIDFHLARWGNQQSNGVFDPTIDPQENNWDRTNFLFADISAGLLWFSVFKSGSSIYAGAAYDHLNQPNQSFSEGNFVALQGKYTLHAGGELNINRQYSILPGVVLLKQGPSFETNAGTSVRFLFGPRDAQQSVQFGLWGRVAKHYENGVLLDAAILSTRFDYDQFGIGFSYDINTSSLSKAANGNGSFEFSLIYKICGAENRGVYCPEF